MEAYILTQILIPSSTRACTDHFVLNSNLLSNEALSQLSAVAETISLSAEQISQLMENLRKRAKSNSTFQKFSSPIIKDKKLCMRTTGFTPIQFYEIFNELGQMRNSDSRTKSQALAVYLFWLKTGAGQETIAAYFDSNELTQQKISHYCEQIREALAGTSNDEDNKSFVQKNLGAKSITREQLCSHNTDFIRVFCGNHENNKAAVVADGTYLRCEKSSNNKVQREAFSMQKKTSLLKPFIICAADGYIIDIYGLYPATVF
jgi:predicted transcriptional regulator